MINRDEYIKKLKSQIDQWNAEAGHWEENAKKAQAGMKTEAERQLQMFHARSEEAAAELRKLQSASSEAFAEMMRGADAAMKGMQDAFQKASQSFNKK